MQNTLHELTYIKILVVSQLVWYFCKREKNVDDVRHQLDVLIFCFQKYKCNQKILMAVVLAELQVY